MHRRDFLATGLTCGAWTLAALAGATTLTRRLFAAAPRGEPVGTEPWGRLERIADGVWSLISTPLAGNRASSAVRTFSNGGIVAGRGAVLAIEGFASVEGATWLAGEARRLTGRWPTHVVLTHYHGDHATGLAGYRASGARVRMLGTAATRDLLQRKRPGAQLPETIVAEARDTELDLGGRRVLITPRDGHTASDLSIEVTDPRVVWCGDLVWIGLFPNFVDATPSRQTAHVRKLAAEPAAVWVPGHGTAAEAARRWRPPSTLGEWVLFSDDYYEVAFRAWERELRT